MATGVALESIRDLGGFARMRGEWGRLHQESHAGPFLAWEWLYPWFRRLGGDRQLMILAARDPGGELLGLMPLSLSGVWAGGRRLRKLSFLGDAGVGSDYLDVVARAGLEWPMALAFAEAIRAARGGWDVVDLLDFDEGSLTIEALRQVFAGEQYRVRVFARHLCPYEPLAPGESFDAFLRRTARRDNFLRRRRWLERQPGFRVEIACAPGELAGPLAELFRLHALRWAGEGGSQGIRGARVEAFHRDATEYLAERGLLRLLTVRVGAEALASVYGIVQGGKFYYYQSGYHPAWRDKSVGLVLVGETFREAIAAGLTGYDFLRGTERYKSEWVRQQRKTVAVRICERGGRGEWLGRTEELSARARALVGRALPGRVAQRIRLRRRTRPG